jgi:hypothetical protein
MNNELERIWKETAVTSKYYEKFSLEELRKTTEIVSG